MKKIISVILSAVMVLSLGVVAFAEEPVCDGQCGNVPTIIIPGVFQSDYDLYVDGKIALNSEGEELIPQFFLPSTVDIVKLALKKAFVPILTTLITQEDKNDRLAKALGDVAGELLMGSVMSDANGDFIKDVRAVTYPQSIGKCTEEDRTYIYDQIPVYDLCQKIGDDHVYFFSYCSFGNMIKTVDELYNYIQMVKEQTGHDKVNIVPISQGGSVCTGLLEFHPEVVDDLNRIIYVVPALNGSVLIGELFEKGFIDDDESLYKTIFPILCDDDTGLTGALINLALRIFPNEVLNNVLDVAFDYVIDNYKMKYSTLMWGLCPAENYENAANKYLTGEEDKEIRRQTDLFHTAQLNRFENIQKVIDAGVEVFDIVDYNKALYPLVESWNKVNADGIIQIDSESMGAFSLGVDVKLPDDYVPAVNNCTDPEHHDHSDPNGIVDPLTGYLPEQTFYFFNADHEKTARNDALIKLVCRLSYDESFKNVYSYPEEFPQFNGTRVVKNIKNDIADLDDFDYSSVSKEDADELKKAIDDINAQLDMTVVDPDAYKKAEDNFYEVKAKVVDGKQPKQESLGDKLSDFFSNLFVKMLNTIGDYLYKTFGGKGYSEFNK